MKIEVKSESCDNYKREEYLILKGMDNELASFLRENKGYLAGGAITSVFTGQKIRDYDMYFPDRESMDKANAWMVSKEAKMVVQTDNAITYKYKKQTYQIIKVVVGTPEEIFQKFDFTVCMGLYDFQYRTFHFEKHFFLHNAQKKLVFNEGTAYPICSMLRTRKYTNRGYIIGGVEDIKLALAVRNLNITNYHELKVQLQGIDTAFLAPLTDAMLEQPDKAFDYVEFLDFMSDILDKYFSELKDNLEMVENESDEG